MPDIKAGLEAVKELDGLLGILAKYISRLKADPDRAASDLTEALEEIEKSCRVLDEAAKRYLSLGFKPDALFEGSDVLLEVGGGGILVAVQRGLGSCHKISNIYWNSLHRWFERVFKSDDAALQEITRVFDALCNADRDMFAGMADAARRIQQLANEALGLISAGRSDKAQMQVRADFAEVNPLRVRMNELLAKLYEVRAQFIEISGV